MSTVYHASVPVDLAATSRQRLGSAQFYYGDNDSHVFTALVADTDDPEAGLRDGTVSGTALRADGVTVVLAGTKGDATEEVTFADGRTANATPCSVTLPQAAFAIPGTLQISIKLTDGTTATTVLSITGTVIRTETDAAVDPGEIIPDLATLQAAAAEALEAAADAEAAAAVMEKVKAVTVNIDEDRTINVQCLRGSYRSTSEHNRLWLSPYIKLDAGQTITIGAKTGYQTKLFAMLNTTTTTAAQETEYANTTTFANPYPVPVYVKVHIKRTDGENMTIDEAYGFDITVTSASNESLTDIITRTVNGGIVDRYAGDVVTYECIETLVSKAFAIDFVVGKHYIFYNKGTKTTTLSTRATSSGSAVETIGSVGAGETKEFTPTVNASYLYCYSGTPVYIDMLVMYGDGIDAKYVTPDTTLSVSGRAADAAAVGGRIAGLVPIASTNLFDPSVTRVTGKSYNSSGELTTATYWSVIPGINVAGLGGHKLNCNKWVETNNRYVRFTLADGSTSVALIDGDPITIPSTAVSVDVTMNRPSENEYDFEDAYIWIDDTQSAYVPYSPIQKHMPIRTFYHVPDDVKGVLDPDSPFLLTSDTKLQNVYDFYDRLTATFNTVMEREQICTTSTPTGEWAEVDNNTYPLYAYHIYPTVASRDTENVFVVNSCIHGDSYPNGATVANDVFEHVAALAYCVKELLFNPENNDITKFIREQCHMVVIPVVNPWGCQNGHRHNGRGVDLNRNFPYAFVANQEEYDCVSGPEALSEAETEGIYEFISDIISDTGIKFHIDFQSRGGSTGIGPNDNRYLPIVYTGSGGSSTKPTREMADMANRVGATMVMRFGGINDPQSTASNGHLSATVYHTLDVPSLTIETFGAPTARYYDRGHEFYTKNSVAYYGEALDVFVQHYIMNAST